MKPKHIRLAVQQTGPVRTETLMGDEYRVVPGTLVQEQVLHNNLGKTYLPAAALTREWAESMNGAPVVVDHPTSRGFPISARSPAVLNASGVGFLFGAHIDGPKVKGEVWIDVSRAAAVNGLQAILEKLDKAEPVELSTGFPVAVSEQKGVFNGRDYDRVLTPGGFDHLAVFADKLGACSVSDGCGLGVNHAGDCAEDVPHSEIVDARNAAEPDADEGATTPPDIEVAAKQPAWRRFGAALVSLLGIRAADNESDEDRRRMLSAALRDQFGAEDTFVFLDSVFSEDGVLVYEVETVDGADGSGLYRVDYEVDDGAVTFGEPTPVRRVTTFEPVANAGESSQEEDAMNRQQMIAQLAANGPLDAVTLEKLTDCQLKALLGAPQAQQSAGAQQHTPTGDPAQDEPWALAHQYRARVEELERQTAAAVADRERKRIRLMDDVLYTRNRPWSDEEVRNMGYEQLEKIHSVLCPAVRTYAGRGGPAASNGASYSPNFVQPILDGAFGDSPLDPRKEAN